MYYNLRSVDKSNVVLQIHLHLPLKAVATLTQMLLLPLLCCCHKLLLLLLWAAVVSPRLWLQTIVVSESLKWFCPHEIQIKVCFALWPCLVSIRGIIHATRRRGRRLVYTRNIFCHLIKRPIKVQTSKKQAEDERGLYPPYS